MAIVSPAHRVNLWNGGKTARSSTRHSLLSPCTCCLPCVKLLQRVIESVSMRHKGRENPSQSVTEEQIWTKDTSQALSLPISQGNARMYLKTQVRSAYMTKSYFFQHPQLVRSTWFHWFSAHTVQTYICSRYNENSIHRHWLDNINVLFSYRNLSPTRTRVLSAICPFKPDHVPWISIKSDIWFWLNTVPLNVTMHLPVLLIHTAPIISLWQNENILTRLHAEKCPREAPVTCWPAFKHQKI
jgi:hypothetical protein